MPGGANLRRKWGDNELLQAVRRQLSRERKLREERCQSQKLLYWAVSLYSSGLQLLEGQRSEIRSTVHMAPAKHLTTQ